MITIEIQLLLHLCPEENRLGCAVCVLKKSLQFQQKVLKGEDISKNRLILVCLDVQVREETVDMAATFLVGIVGAVNSDNWRRANGLSLERKTISVYWKALIEGSAVWRGQIEHVVIVSEGENAHLHLVGCLGVVPFHIIKSIGALLNKHIMNDHLK